MRLLQASLVAAVALLTVFLAPLLAAQQSRQFNAELYGAQEAQAFTLAVQAYIYGYPLVEMERTKRLSTGVSEPDRKGRAPTNMFGHFADLADAAARDVVTPNNDTIYSIAWLDLSDQPVILHVPDMKGRYYVFQLLDAYTNNFENIARRKYGTNEADYAIVGPGWSGTLPAGAKRIDSPTDTVWVIGRTLVSGPEDLATVHALQRQYALAPLSAYGARAASVGAGSVETRWTADAAALASLSQTPEGIAFFQMLGDALRENPPQEYDAALVAQFEQIGLSPEHGFQCDELTPAALAGLLRASPVAQQLIDEKVKTLGESINGWLINPDTGRYGYDYLLRAAVAKKGLGALVPEEAIYPIADVDGDGKQLTGTHRYVLHFDKGQMPPVDAFWSITMYGSDRFLVDNPIDRYSIGDRTEGLEYGPDGSLDVYIQQEAPKGHESNWLPAPAGDFYVVMRMYEPKQAVLDGSYRVPPIRRVD